MRIVVKVGTSTIAHSTGRLNIRQVEKLCKVLSDLKNAGHEVILVSSGAIGMGVGKLSLKGRPKDMPGKQAAAAVGQCELMYTYDKLFTEYNHVVAQILLTGDDLDHTDRKQNFQNTLYRLLELGALPIINENDTVATQDDPNARLIPVVEELTPEIFALAGDKGSELATGGMVTKLHAAQIATEQGVSMVISNGAVPEHLYDIVEGKPVGTKFVGRKRV